MALAFEHRRTGGWRALAIVAVSCVAPAGLEACARTAEPVVSPAASASVASPSSSAAASASTEIGAEIADAIDEVALGDGAVTDADLDALSADGATVVDEENGEDFDETTLDGATTDAMLDALADAAQDAGKDAASHDAGHALSTERVVDAGPSKPLPPPTASVAKILAHCRPQQAQSFLIRTNFIPIGAHKDVFDHSIRYRTEQYGYTDGFGQRSWNPLTPESQSENAIFMGLSVRMHKKVVPALRCAEAQIRKSCSATPYVPEHLAGIRYKNTYRGGEVTNHLYSIAIDIDPAKNPCCGCMVPWSDAPVCKKKVAAPEERMAMPSCWVKAFEKYGWYWLGHDRLQDTMHFEFLGDPSRITK